LPIIQRIDDRQYQNVAEVAEAARLVQHWTHSHETKTLNK
jgi:hypothetical protein